VGSNLKLYASILNPCT